MDVCFWKKQTLLVQWIPFAAGIKPLVDDFLYLRLIFSILLSWRILVWNCLFASVFGKHSWIFLTYTIFKNRCSFFYICVKEFANEFNFNFLVALMKKLFIVLENSLSFVMIVLFSTRVILLEIDPFFFCWNKLLNG